MNDKKKKHEQQTTELAALPRRVAKLEQEIARFQQENQALEESVERFRVLFEASPSAITVIQDGRFVFANPIAAQMLGYSNPQEIIGLLTIHCITPESRELAMKQMGQLAAGAASPPAQLELLRKDGTTLFVESSMIPIVLDGQAAGMMIATNITERKRTEQALQESEQRYRHLVDNAPIGIISFDTQGQIMAVNPALVQILGSPSAEATRAINVLTFPPLVQAGIVAKFRQCLDSGDSIVTESSYTSKWSKQTHLRYHLEAIRDETGAITGVQAMVEDITGQKQIEQEEEILGAISQLFLASASLNDAYAGLPTILASLFQLPIVAIELYDSTTNEMILVGSTGLDIETADPIRTPVDQTLSGTVVSTGQAIGEADTGRWLKNQSLGELGIQAFLCVPVQATQRAIGTISIADRQEHSATASLLDTLDAVAYRLHQEIERKQTADALHYNTKRLEILREIDQAILAAESPIEIAQATLAQIRTILPCRRASIVAYDFEANEGIVLAAHVEGETQMGLGARIGLGGLVDGDQNVRMVMVNDIAALPEIQPSSQIMLAEGVRSYLFIPLWVQNELIGALNIGSTAVGAFAPEHVELAQQVANSLAIAIQNARLYERAHKEIAERRTAEAALRESERRYRNLIETMNDGLVTVDKQKQITFANDRFCEMLDYSRDEIIGRHISSFHDEINQAIIQDQWSRRRQGDRAPYELAYTRRSGESLHVILSPRPVLDSEGHFDGSISVITDITALKRAEQERSLLLTQIREQAQQMQQIIHTVPDGVILLDTLNQIILANTMAKKMLPTLARTKDGDQLTHLAGRPLSELLTPPRAGLWHKLELLEPQPQFFKVIARPIEYRSALDGQVLVIRDVTQEQEIQQRVQQQERLAAVGQLAAGIAHDFNNIMAVILLYTQLLSRTLDCAPADRERLETIVKQSHRASELINQILDFSRSSMLERKLVNLESILKEQVKLLRRTLPENIEIELVSGGGEYTIDADLTRIQQVIMNLAVNARDAMPNGGLLQLSLSRTKPDELIQCVTCGEVDPAEWVRLTVSDTGIGIAAEVFPHIFEPFFTTKEPGRGSGLGLAQVYGIVLQHEGHINVTTTPETGTVFSIYLPALPQVEADEMSETAAAVLEGQGQTILVVEDEPAVRQALVNILERLDYRPLEAENGLQARQLYEQHRQEIALVLTDLVMPGMGGLDLCQELIQLDPAVQVILLTGYPLEKDLNELRSMGVADWLKKPVSLTQLSQTIAKALYRD